MSRPPKPPVFLQRANYRQRRVRDAIRLVPFVGAMLWALPLAWSQDSVDSRVGSAGVIYIFAVWVLLIVVTSILASRIRVDPTQGPAEDPDA